MIVIIIIFFFGGGGRGRPLFCLFFGGGRGTFISAHTLHNLEQGYLEKDWPQCGYHSQSHPPSGGAK